MPSQHVTIINRLGLHARASAKFVQTAAGFPCDIKVVRDGACVNGKSIMGLMTLAAAKGATLELKTSGAQEDAALAALVRLIEDRFGEPE